MRNMRRFIFQILLTIFFTLAVYGDVSESSRIKRDGKDEEVIPELCGLTKADEKELDDKKQAKALDRYPQEENAKMADGDIELTEAQKKLLKKSQKEKGSKASPKEVVNEELAKRWPRGKPIAYMFDASLDDEAKAAITKAVNHIQQFTCVEFNYVEAKPSDPYIEFYKGTGCHGPLGMRDWEPPNRISIDDRCKDRGIIVHEVMHSLGFIHEHSREDRDEYIDINWANFEKIDDEDEYKLGEDLFWEKRHAYKGNSFGLPYDFNSIMHYPVMACSKDKKTPTIVLKEKWRKKCESDKKRCNIGQRHGLSKSDAKQINLLFGCPAKKKAAKKSECPEYHDPKDFLLKSWPKKG